MSKSLTMPLDEYIKLYESIKPDLSMSEAFKALESIHKERYGSHKCNTIASFKSMKSRHYRLKRERLRVQSRR